MNWAASHLIERCSEELYKMEGFHRNRQDKEVISKKNRRDFRQGCLTSADQKISEIPFLAKFKIAIKSWFAVLGASGSTLGLFPFSSPFFNTVFIPFNVTFFPLKREVVPIFPNPSILVSM